MSGHPELELVAEYGGMVGSMVALLVGHRTCNL